MFRGLLKLLLVIVILVAAGAFLLGWWGGGAYPANRRPIEASALQVTRKARAAGAEVGEKTAQAADRTAAAAARDDRRVAKKRQARPPSGRERRSAKVA